MERIPLAEKMRPKQLSDVVGQNHLIGDGKILTKIIEKSEPVNLILWGPPGTGKTTLARIIAGETEAEFIELSAVTSGKKDVTKVVEIARQNWNLKLRTILFVDEIHRFNKAQQDAFLPHVESGLITLIGATTANPSFEIITPLLSRSRVLTLELLGKNELLEILQRAVKLEKLDKRVSTEALDFIAEISAGDARAALGNLELALTLTKKSGKITLEDAKAAAQRVLPGYDKKGEMHYNVISAFIKSMRGSDADAALYYLARMLQAGEDPKFIARRMIIFASEDIGLAGNGALQLALNAFQAVERVGMPEAKYILFHTASALTLSKKSRRTTEAMYRAESLAAKSPNIPVPLHLRNPETKLMKDLGYGKDYEWKSDFKHSKGFLPEEIGDDEIF